MAFTIPKPLLRNTGNAEDVYRNIDDFFLQAKTEIERRLNYDDSSMPTLFEIRVMGLYKNPQNSPLDSEEKVHTLLFLGRPAALVMETRSDLNYVQFDFFENIDGIVGFSRKFLDGLLRDNSK